MKATRLLGGAVLGLLVWGALACEARGEPAERRWFVGSSLFVLANLVPDDHPPAFYQLNAGMRFGHAHAVSLEAITWRYYHPLGIPWGSERDSPGEEYPGHVREAGVGIAYQYLFWKGAYASISAVPLLRSFRDHRDREVGSGFQLFVTGRLGWHLDLLERFFVEPSVAITAWPSSSGAPPGFAAKDERWPRYFLLEPGFHLGVEL